LRFGREREGFGLGGKMKWKGREDRLPSCLNVKTPNLGNIKKICKRVLGCF
jgi:hypothetical protein